MWCFRRQASRHLPSCRAAEGSSAARRVRRPRPARGARRRRSGRELREESRVPQGRRSGSRRARGHAAGSSAGTVATAAAAADGVEAHRRGRESRRTGRAVVDAVRALSGPGRQQGRARRIRASLTRHWTRSRWRYGAIDALDGEQTRSKNTQGLPEWPSRAAVRTDGVLSASEWKNSTRPAQVRSDSSGISGRATDESLRPVAIDAALGPRSRNALKSQRRRVAYSRSSSPIPGGQSAAATRQQVNGLDSVSTAQRAIVRGPGAALIPDV